MFKSYLHNERSQNCKNLTIAIAIYHLGLRYMYYLLLPMEVKDTTSENVSVEGTDYRVKLRFEV